MTLDARPLAHFAGHVKHPMQNSAYTTTRERMQAPVRHRKGQRIPHKPAHTTQASTCQALRDTCTYHIRARMSSTCKTPASIYHKSQRKSTRHTNQSVSSNIFSRRVLTGHGRVCYNDEGGVLKSFCSFQSGSMAASIPPL